ncbi:MAG TPA: tRNA uridine-5-carboxymethylaminomethyl(34) synthesis enzyme MnmG [Peptococcaceae bacterium]|nr:MAG: tRNA uridine 5-carboxymethylaminomethyl modification enzyme MnmG [Clostridia bacterium 41_269]HBT19798.1 tRNA uridine-5-carboxymethylaminomethyl(34) synthesis enzyme MnmG [Peptococcaceae bacterium]
MPFSAGKYDVIVIGAGHAGIEAALAAARLGCKTLCLTVSMEAVALMPCNPAIGGPGKSHLVREVDALGGQMAISADRTCIQIRMLNTGKGPAVRALRCQSDKKLYQAEMLKILQHQKNLHLKQALVEEIIFKGCRVEGVMTQTGAIYWAPVVILASGTYLGGRVIIGDVNYSSGPSGFFPANKLPQQLKAHGIKMVRFKTGTPARVDKNTVDFSAMIEQKGDDEELYFSFMSENLKRPNVSCWLTYTNEKTHKIIRDNLHRSPLFSGVIKGVGPRYCPSIEDKVVRFADKESHQVFLEPEGLGTTEMYVQGMSTSLPEDVQLEMLRSIKGLERVEIVRPGYAIEYDCLVPTQLYPTLEHKEIEGFFSAGQVNGTSGYEEAAAQGIVAGINGARKVLGEEPVTFMRSEAYIGVLIDDLVTKGTNEPYRILTSRAEYRLLLRQDNADLRLTEKGRKIGLVSDERYEKFLKRKKMIEEELERLRNYRVKPSNKKVQELLIRKGSAPIKNSITFAELLKRPELDYRDIEELLPDERAVPKDVLEQVWIELKYEGYIKKQLVQVEKFKKMEDRKIPENISYKEIKGLRTEAVQKLEEIKPKTLGQASRISGVSPADISVIMIYLEQKRRSDKKGVPNGGKEA